MRAWEERLSLTVHARTVEKCSPLKFLIVVPGVCVFVLSSLCHCTSRLASPYMKRGFCLSRLLCVYEEKRENKMGVCVRSFVPRDRLDRQHQHSESELRWEIVIVAVTVMVASVLLMGGDGGECVA